MQKLPEQKNTVHFKLNLKTDGPDCKMIFNFGKHVERFHSIRGADVYTTSASASNVSVYTNTICVAKCLLGTPKPLNCTVPMQAICSRNPQTSFSHSAFKAAAASAFMPSFRRRAAYQRVELSLCTSLGQGRCLAAAEQSLPPTERLLPPGRCRPASGSSHTAAPWRWGRPR